MNTDKSKSVKRLKTFLTKYDEYKKEFGDDNLYEDANTEYTLSDVTILKTKVKFTETYHGYTEDVFHEESNDEEDLSEWVTKWNADLRRAKRYMAMDAERLEAIQDGDAEDEDDE